MQALTYTPIILLRHNPLLTHISNSQATEILNLNEYYHHLQRKLLELRQLQGQRKLFITGQAKLDPEHYSLKCKGG